MTEEELNNRIDERAATGLNEIKPVVAELKETIKNLQKPDETKESQVPEYHSGIQVNEPDFKYKSIGEQLIDVRNANITHDPNAWKRLDNANLTAAKVKEITGAGEQIPADGGFLVQSDFVDELLVKTHETGILWKMCRKVEVGPNANGIIMNYVDERARTTGNRWGGVRGYWLAEGGTKTDSKPKFGQLEVKLNKLIGLFYSTDELLQDATALTSVVSQAFPEEFGFLVDDAIINGSGAGKPLGILNAPCLVSVAKETGQDTDTVIMENVQQIWNKTLARNRIKGAWFINQDVETELMNMTMDVGTGGVPVYLPPGGLSQTPYAQLFSRPVMPIEQCPVLGDKGDIIFADFTEYLIIEKGGIQTATSIHVSFSNDETAFRFVLRIGGQPLPNAPLAAFKGQTKRSPFVTVADRA